MKVFRHKNGNLYTIETIGWGKTITRHPDWDSYVAIPYYLNKNAPLLPKLGSSPDLSDFKLEFEV